MTQKTLSGENTPGKAVGLKDLVGSGDKIMLLTLPVIFIGLILNILFPAWFSVGGPVTALKVISIIILVPGVVLWLWAVVLILTRVPQKKLITSGPFLLTKHPIYNSVALLVLPWFGFLLNTWLGAVVGVVLYIASRLFVPDEEKQLSKTFGKAWEEYSAKVILPWL